MMPLKLFARFREWYIGHWGYWVYEALKAGGMGFLMCLFFLTLLCGCGALIILATGGHADTRIVICVTSSVLC